MSTLQLWAEDNEEKRRNNGMSINFEIKYFNSKHNLLKNGQHPLVRTTRNIVKNIDELGELVLYIIYFPHIDCIN